ncbi:MAG: efflux RND transporter periplasmic adaptor subunit [Rhizobiaceae bacterium]
MLDKISDDTENGKSGSTQPEPSSLSHYQEVPVDQAPPQLGAPDKRSFGRLIGNIALTVLQAILVIAIIAGALYITKTMIEGKPKPRVRPAFKTIYTIETITAKVKDHQPLIISYGQTVAARTVDLRSLVSGEITKVNKNLRAGAQVNKGDALVSIDDFNYRGALLEAQASVSEAKARILENSAQIVLEKSKLAASIEQLKISKSDLRRAQKLKKRGSSTVKELDARRLIVSQRKQSVDLSTNTIKVQQSRATQIEASIERLEWRVRQAKRNLESTTLIAPFTGIVRSSSAEVGRAITANDVVVSLYEANTLEVKFTLTDAQYGRLQSSQIGLIERPVKVTWSVGDKGYTYAAIIDRVGAEIASNRGGVELFAIIDKPNNKIAIRPGAFVEVLIPDLLFTSTISVPDTSIYENNLVYVEYNGKLERRKVSVVTYDGEKALIASGINEGDEVLVTRITEVSEGLLVRREGDKLENKNQTRVKPRDGE